jgi:hypothetical protein
MKKRLGLISLIASIAVTSIQAGELDLISDLKISGDARVRGVSVDGDTAASRMDKQEFESRVRLNLDFKVDDSVSVHTRIVADNNAWGNNNNDEFTWDEAYVVVPFNKDKFLLAGRIEDSYGTKFYGSNGDPIDLALVGYNPTPDILLYAFDFKAVEGSVVDQGSSLGLSSTGDGDFDAYSVGGQITIDELVVGGRYVFLQNNTAIGNGAYADADSHMFNAFALGKYAGLDIQAQIEKRTGDKYSGGIVDEKMFGAYLNVAKDFDGFKVGLAALKTQDGYVSGSELPVSYLTNDDLGMAALGRVGAYGDTTLFAANFSYAATSDLTLEANFAHHNIDNATLNGISKDIKIAEYDLGLKYSLTKNTDVSFRYAQGNFNESSLEDLTVIVGAIEISF